MKLSNERLANILSVYNNAIASVHFKSVKTILFVKQQKAKIIECLKPFEEAKTDVVNRFGSNGVLETEKLSKENAVEFFRMWDELHASEVEIDFGNKILLSELKLAGKIPSALELEVLEPLIEIDIEE